MKSPIQQAVLVFVVSFMLVGFGQAEDEVDHAGQRYQAVENPDGAGFFWVDTTTGKLWLLDAGPMAWKYLGAPEGAPAEAMGTYVPRKNKSGTGLYILNTLTGQGWWTDGAIWKNLGVPTE